MPLSPPEKAMAPHSSTLAWKIPWKEEPGGLQSMGSLSRTRLSDFPFTFHFHAAFQVPERPGKDRGWHLGFWTEKTPGGDRSQDVTP